MIGEDRLSIKEFSKLTGVKETTLRYYDDMGLFSPAMRGDNKYRYYSPQQLTTINSINLLHDLDMPIKRISEIERKRTPETVIEVLAEKESELEKELSRLNHSFNIIHTLRDMISEGLDADENKLIVADMDELKIVIGEENDFGDSVYFYEAFLTFCAHANGNGIDLRFPVGGMFDDFDAFVKLSNQPSHFFSVDPTGSNSRVAGKYLVGYARGYYGETGDLPQRMAAHIKENKLTPKGPLYVIYLHDEICIRDQHQYLFQASVQVEE